MGRNRSLPPLEEFFLVLVRLRLGLFEKDLADRFGISTSSVSRICITWINFLYLKLHEIPLWLARDKVKSSMPKSFRYHYPTTWVIIDATEIFVENPSVPEMQQRTFSSYKNHNTYKGKISAWREWTHWNQMHCFPPNSRWTCNGKDKKLPHIWQNLTCLSK